MPILMMSLMTVSLTEDSETDWSFGYKWVTSITLVVCLVIGFFPQENSDGTFTFGLYTQSDDNLYGPRFFIACIIATVSLIILGLILKLRKQGLKRFNNVSLACVCIIAIIYGNVFIATGRSHSYEIKDVVIDSLIEGEVDLGDETQFRVDVYDGVDNTSMYLGLPGIALSYSIASLVGGINILIRFKKKYNNLNLKAILNTLVKSFVSCVVMAFLVSLIKELDFGGGKINLLLKLGVSGVVGVVVYSAMLVILRTKEIKAFLRIN